MQNWMISKLKRHWNFQFGNVSRRWWWKSLYLWICENLLQFYLEDTIQIFRKIQKKKIRNHVDRSISINSWKHFVALNSCVHIFLRKRCYNIRPERDQTRGCWWTAVHLTPLSDRKRSNTALKAQCYVTDPTK